MQCRKQASIIFNSSTEDERKSFYSAYKNEIVSDLSLLDEESIISQRSQIDWMPPTVYEMDSCEVDGCEVDGCEVDDTDEVTDIKISDTVSTERTIFKLVCM